MECVHVGVHRRVVRRVPVVEEFVGDEDVTSWIKNVLLLLLLSEMLLKMDSVEV